MAMPLVIAYHLIWSGYGWWLPNDLRGSMSHFLYSDLLRDLGEIHYGRRRVQPAWHRLLEEFDFASTHLNHEMGEFSANAVRCIADAFRLASAELRYTCYACAIMPDHVHVVIRKHRDSAEEMIFGLQEASRLRLRTSGLFPETHPVWGGPGWKVFLDHPTEVRRTIKYVDDNPTKMRRARQHWDFVVPYDGWPPHPGHDPNSPYAKRLRAVGRYP
jgi:REP element-mobilizing transposase RayT